MSKDKRCVIGIDIGGTKIMACLYDPQFRLVTKARTKTHPDEGEKHFLETLKNVTRQVIRDAHLNRDEVMGIGLGCPGIVHEKRGTILSSPNIRFLKNYPLAQKVSKATGLPACAANDVKAGLYGEQQFGAAKGYRHVIGMFIGTGIGGAVIVDGRIIYGSGGGAGEFGHIQVSHSGPLCGCGKRGCLEAMASRLAIAAEAAALSSKQMAPALFRKAGTDVRDIRSGTIAKAIRAGDRALEVLIRDKAKLIGNAIGNIINVTNPELAVLGGGLTEALARYIVPEAQKAMYDSAMPALAKTVRVVPAKLGDFAVAMGAAKMAWDRYHG